MTAALIPLLISYLVWTIPVPWNLVQAPALEWLKTFDAAWTARIAGLLGVPAVLQGTFIHLTNMILEVADSCSGTESMRALAILSILYASLLQVSPLRQLAVIASALPIAVLSNLVRLVITTLLVHHVGPVAMDGWFHQSAGMFNFLLALCLLALVGEAISGKGHSNGNLRDLRRRA